MFVAGDGLLDEAGVAEWSAPKTSGGGIGMLATNLGLHSFTAAVNAEVYCANSPNHLQTCGGSCESQISNSYQYPTYSRIEGRFMFN